MMVAGWSIASETVIVGAAALRAWRVAARSSVSISYTVRNRGRSAALGPVRV
jgi:hypothetical protein